MNYALLTNCQAKTFFQVTAQRFTKARAVVETAKLFSVTKTAVRAAAYYW